MTKTKQIENALRAGIIAKHALEIIGCTNHHMVLDYCTIVENQIVELKQSMIDCEIGMITMPTME